MGILGRYRRSASRRQDSQEQKTREVTVNAVAQAMKLHKTHRLLSQTSKKKRKTSALTQNSRLPKRATVNSKKRGHVI